MSEKTVFNPSRIISRDLRDQIAAEGISLDNFVSNITTQLEHRGLYELRDQLVNELREHLHCEKYSTPQ